MSPAGRQGGQPCSVTFFTARRAVGHVPGPIPVKWLTLSTGHPRASRDPPHARELPGQATSGGHARRAAAQLDRFRTYYNQIRPHRAIGCRTPEQAYAGRPKAVPRGPRIPVHCRVPRDRIDRGGGITLRHHSRLRHIKVGRRHAATRVLMLVSGLNVRIVSEDGELIRGLTIDPTRGYGWATRGTVSRGHA
jgi:hypothetical protein